MVVPKNLYNFLLAWRFQNHQQLVYNYCVDAITNIVNEGDLRAKSNKISTVDSDSST